VLTACALLAASVLCAPAFALARTGGTGFGAAAATGGTATVGAGESATAGAGASRFATSGASASSIATSGNGTVTATGGGFTITSQASALLRKRLLFTGNAPTGAAGSTVEIERLGHETNWTWAPTAQATIAGNGSFTVAWQVNHIGRFEFRAVLEGAQSAAASPPYLQSQLLASNQTSPAVTVIVYRLSLATVYGPGLYNNHTACGEVLRPRTVGVANRTLPCGTPVALYYQGRTIVVPVIDRGPYANGADWDLTEATARALGMPGTELIGAVSLPARAPSS
jgi:hypothetical protein